MTETTDYQATHLVFLRFVRNVVEAAGGQVPVGCGGTIC